MDARQLERLIDLEQLLDGNDRDGSRNGSTGLPVQPREQEVSIGRPGLQPGQGEREYPPVRSKSGSSAGGTLGAHRAGNASGERGNLPVGGSGSSPVTARKPGGSVQGAELTFGSRLPALSDGHWIAPDFPIAEVAQDGIRDEHDSVEQESPPERLTRLVGKSLRKLEYILDLELSPWDDGYVKLLSMQKDASTSIINLGIRADESRFRVQNESAIVAILQEVRALKASNTLVIECQT